MSIVVNGTTIPENVANALNVNGTNITSVVCDGVTVWTQSLIVREPVSGEYYSSALAGSYGFFQGAYPNGSGTYICWNSSGYIGTGAGSTISRYPVSSNLNLLYWSDGTWTYYRGSFKLTAYGASEYGVYRILN